MFDLVLTTSTPAPPLRQRALAALGEVLTRQATLAYHDVVRKRDYIRAQVQDPNCGDARALGVDLERAETLLAFFTRVTRNPTHEATVRLEPLLQLLEGPLCALEWTHDRMAARVLPGFARDRHIRIVLVPDGMRRRRVQIQEFDPTHATPEREAIPRCYGDVGQAYIGWALNRLDLRTLILATIAYLREN